MLIPSGQMLNRDLTAASCERNCVFFFFLKKKKRVNLYSLLFGLPPGDSSGQYCSSSTLGIPTNMLPTITVLPFLKHLILVFCIYSFPTLPISLEDKKGPEIQHRKCHSQKSNFTGQDPKLITYLDRKFCVLQVFYISVNY